MGADKGDRHPFLLLPAVFPEPPPSWGCKRHWGEIGNRWDAGARGTRWVPVVAPTAGSLGERHEAMRAKPAPRAGSGPGGHHCCPNSLLFPQHQALPLVLNSLLLSRSTRAVLGAEAAPFLPFSARRAVLGAASASSPAAPRAASSQALSWC